MTKTVEDRGSAEVAPQARRFVLRDGRVYFSRDTERRFFFLLTLAAAAAALAHRCGWLG
jgi:hypothetical protein